jgi:hypothetical protein
MKTSGSVLILLLLASQAHANVGGYYRRALGGFDPSATNRIRIIHEHLTIHLRPTAADVEVRYVMRNQTDVPMTARFGFPMRIELNGEHSFTCEIADDPKRQEIPVRNHHKPLKMIKLTVLEAWPGSKHEDLCVAGVEVVSQIQELPKFRWE